MYICGSVRLRNAIDLVRLRHPTGKYTEIYCKSAILSSKIQCSGVHYLLRSLYCKQKVDESQQSGSCHLELNNILSPHDCKCAFSGECN